MLDACGNQRFTARDDWRVSPLTRQMAAFATLGFRVVVEQARDDLTGTGRTVFLHSPQTMRAERAGLPRAKELMRLFRSGKLEEVDPEHPLLDALGGIASFEALEDWRLKGVSCCLAADAIPKGMGPLAARRGRLVPGVPPVRAKGAAYVDVANVANAAALARVGVPVLSLHAQGERTIYRMAAVGEALADRAPVQTKALVDEAAAGELAWDHPLLTARQGVLDFVTLMRLCREAIEHTVITWRNNTDRRQASLLASASKKAEDMAWRHMR